VSYSDFLQLKTQSGADRGFDPVFMPPELFDFQQDLVQWAVRKGRAAIFADCGLGKTAMQLTWAQNVAQHTDKPVLILTPLAVAAQTIREGEKFGIECARSSDGAINSRIVITNYERLDHFTAADFAGVVCDESSILKSFDGARRNQITEFMRKVPYRLLATATAAPNDFIELGTSSEALGYMGYMDMLARFFKNDQSNLTSRRMYGEAPKWRFKGHAEQPFWRWVTSWARACRRPSDLGFDDGRFILPPLNEIDHLIETSTVPEGMLFAMPATDLREQRAEKKRTVQERCEQVAAMVADTGQPALVWCHLNEEGNLLEQLIPDAIQVSGSDRDDVKESRLIDFAEGRSRVLITKPKIGAWGLNFQQCSHITYFPSHSFEQYYQSVRRCWRFGQKNSVTVDIILTEGERRIMENLQRKRGQAERMFASLVSEMNNSLAIEKAAYRSQPIAIPSWMSSPTATPSTTETASMSCETSPARQSTSRSTRHRLPASTSTAPTSAT
jgi:superfamily II DNA or RNA helicase